MHVVGHVGSESVDPDPTWAATSAPGGETVRRRVVTVRTARAAAVAGSSLELRGGHWFGEHRRPALGEGPQALSEVGTRHALALHRHLDVDDRRQVVRPEDLPEGLFRAT